MKPPPDHIIQLFRKTPGALSVHEGLALYDLMGIVPDEGTIVECGSHKGKSGIAIAAGLSRGSYRLLNLVDPIFEERDLMKMVLVIVNTGGSGYVQVCGYPLISEEALPQIFEETGPFAFAFLDSGDHAYELVRSEFDFLKDKMVPGGIIALHDVGNYQGPLRLYKEAQNEGFEPVNICWDEIKELVAANGGETGNNSWHCTDNPAPCFLAALRKV